MLFLTRKVGESIIIDNKVRLEIIELKGRVVKLGFFTDENVSIDREEIYLKRKKDLNERLKSEDTPVRSEKI